MFRQTSLCNRITEVLWLVDAERTQQDQTQTAKGVLIQIEEFIQVMIHLSFSIEAIIPSLPFILPFLLFIFNSAQRDYDNNDDDIDHFLIPS